MAAVWIAVVAAMALGAVGGFALGRFRRHEADPQIQERLMRYCMPR